jgi:hypothetical protein
MRKLFLAAIFSVFIFTSAHCSDFTFYPNTNNSSNANASNLTSGTVPIARLSSSVVTNNYHQSLVVSTNSNVLLRTYGTRGVITLSAPAEKGPIGFPGGQIHLESYLPVSVSADMTVQGQVTAAKFSGDGSLLTGVNATLPGNVVTNNYNQGFTVTTNSRITLASSFPSGDKSDITIASNGGDGRVVISASNPGDNNKILGGQIRLASFLPVVVTGSMQVSGVVTANSFAGTWGGGAIPVTRGGTGASTSSDARVNLGLGSMATQSTSTYVTLANAIASLNAVVAYAAKKQDGSSALSSISGLNTATGNIIYTTAPNTYSTSNITSTGRTILAQTTTADLRTKLELGASDYPRFAGLVGSNGTSAARAGDVGEYIKYATTNVTISQAADAFGDVFAFQVPAGDWDIAVLAVASNTLAPAAILGFGISDTPGNDSDGLIEGDNFVEQSYAAGVLKASFAIPMYSIRASAPFIMYLKYHKTFTSTESYLVNASVGLRRRR